MFACSFFAPLLSPFTQLFPNKIPGKTWVFFFCQLRLISELSILLWRTLCNIQKGCPVSVPDLTYPDHVLRPLVWSSETEKDIFISYITYTANQNTLSSLLRQVVLPGSGRFLYSYILLQSNTKNFKWCCKKKLVRTAIWASEV